MHGPGTIFSPRWPTFPEVPVVDGIAASLGLRRRARWRKSRDAGLAMWLPAGLTFEVVEGPATTFVGIGEPDWPTSSGEQDGFVRPGRIALVRSTYTPPLPKYWQTAWGFWSGFLEGGAAFFHLERLKWITAHGGFTLKRTVAHEVGHCIGLAHGGTGIMSGGLVPDDHDLDSVRQWYYEEAA